MYQGTKLQLRTALILPKAASRKALVAEIMHDTRFKITGEFTTLDAAYAPTEARPPNLTICHKALARQPEFPMFAAMLSMIGSALITVDDATNLSIVAEQIGLPQPARPKPETPPRAGSAPCQKVVAIGASTGGIEALSTLLSTYPASCPPTVIVQHIQPGYLDGVVARLDRVCPATVITAQAHQPLESGQVIVAPGLPMHLEVQPRTLRCILRDAPAVSGHRPSVDVLFQSVTALKDMAVGVLLTGMGRDGATGLGEMRKAGAHTIAQDAATSTVHGMPRVAFEEGAVCEVLPLSKISNAIVLAASKGIEARVLTT